MKLLACEQAEALLTPLLDGELREGDKGPLDAHLAACSKCAEAREDTKALALLLRRHYHARAESIVTAKVLRALEGEVTEALVRHENDVSKERAEAMTEAGAPAARPAAPRSGVPRSQLLDEGKRLLGAVLGGYRIDGEIARGGMGTVFRATQLSMQREVALKVLSRKFAVDETFVKRFIREAKASANIEHPNVIKVYDAGEDKGDTFFAMELVEGDDAETLVLRDGAFTPRRAAEIGLGVARALEAAHARGVVHRDVKPANVLVVRATGAVKLADLGLAKLEDAGAGEDGHLTLRRVVMGSPNYMPPEQARDARDTDQRSDVYSLGATLFHLATGERPWGGGTAVEIVARVVDPQPLAIPERSKEGAAIDPGVRAIIARACHKDRAKRYPTMTALREDLELFVALEEPRAAREAPAPGRGRSQRAKVAKPGTGRKNSRRSSGEMAALAAAPPWKKLVVPVGTVLAGSLAFFLLLRRGQPTAATGDQGIAATTSDGATAATSSDPTRPKPPVAMPGDPAPVPTRALTDTLGDRQAYADLVRDGDRLASLDRLGEQAGIYEAFLRDHAGCVQAEKVRRELGDLHDRISKRAHADLDRATDLMGKNDLVGAEDVLTGIDGYGDDAARAKAHVALDALRARAKAMPIDKPPVQKPDAPPPAPPPPPPAPPPATPPDKPDDASLLAKRIDLSKFLAGRIEPLPGERARLLYDWSAPAQVDDWPALAREPASVGEALDALPPTSSPYPYDRAKPWSLVKGSLFLQGFERHATKAIFEGGPLKVEILARFLAGRGLVVTLGDPKHPFVIAIATAAPDASIPSKPGRSRDEQDALSKLQRKWRATFARPAIVVARELDAFDWEPTGLSSPFKPDTKSTRITIEARRDEDGDSIVVTVDGQREKVALGKDALAAGPIGLESFGRAVVVESVSIEGAADKAWLKTLPGK